MEEIGIGEFARRSRLSLKALRLYDERGVLVPARVEPSSGYRYYDTAQLDQARLVVMLRELQLPLAAIKELLAADPADAAARIARHWHRAEAAHDARRELADYLVSRLNGKRPVMDEVSIRQIPERSLLCLLRDVDQQGMWAFGKEFIGIFRDRPLPATAKAPGRAGAAFCIWWSTPTPDVDGPIEWCSPVLAEQAESLAARYPELTVRTEPAHQEAFVALPDAGDELVHWGLACESLDAWTQRREREHAGAALARTPDELGLRITYLFSARGSGDPLRDLAIPFAVGPVTGSSGPVAHQAA